jgi:5-formyltetrahydrofolate cyclo-ligase
MLSKQEHRDHAKQRLSKLSKQDIKKSSERMYEKLSQLIDRYQVWSVFLPLSDEPQLHLFLDLLVSK